MFCSKCGKPQKENARFCSSCGSPLSAAEASGADSSGTQPPPDDVQPPSANVPPDDAQPPSGSVPPDDAPPPSANVPPPAAAPRFVPPMPAAPKKSNAKLFVILACAAVAVAGAVVAIILLTSKPASAPLPSATAQASAIATASPDITPVSLRLYVTPTLDNSLQIASVLTTGSWELSGIAYNPDRIDGSEGVYTLASFADYYERLTFTGDGKYNMYSEGSGETYNDSHTYEITGTNYCDSEKNNEGDYTRFYLATDGNLYATVMYKDGTVSDYAVYKHLNP